MINHQCFFRQSRIQHLVALPSNGFEISFRSRGCLWFERRTVEKTLEATTFYGTARLAIQGKLTSESSTNTNLAEGASGLLCAKMLTVNFGFAFFSLDDCICLKSSRADLVLRSKADKR